MIRSISYTTLVLLEAAEATVFVRQPDQSTCNLITLVLLVESWLVAAKLLSRLHRFAIADLGAAAQE